jgi:hypothetical protein
MKRNASQDVIPYIEMVGLYLQHLAVLLAHLSNSRVSPNPPFPYPYHRKPFVSLPVYHQLSM